MFILNILVNQIEQVLDYPLHLSIDIIKDAKALRFLVINLVEDRMDLHTGSSCITLLINDLVRH